MELRTTFSITPSEGKITYDDKVVFIGSCFATSIGRQFELGHLPVLINPAGTVYNPVSVCNTLDKVTCGIPSAREDLYNSNGTWLSFDHHTDFASEDPEELLKTINERSKKALEFMSGASFLFITFGTARIYRWKETGKIVSNCHKLPAALFTQELLTVNEIVDMWDVQLNRLNTLFPDLRVIFTISPVRHWKDSAHGNQVSKSVLFLAVEEFLKHSSGPVYFPAYELVMDDLRDYRFYDDDMLHLSSAAVEYIWNAFSDCYFENETRDLYKEIIKITRSVSHRIHSGSSQNLKTFAETMLNKINAILSREPSLNFDSEKKYFLDLLSI